MNGLARIGRFVDNGVPEGVATTVSDPWFRLIDALDWFDEMDYVGSCEFVAYWDESMDSREIGRHEAILGFYPTMFWLILLVIADGFLPVGVSFIAVVLLGGLTVLGLPMIGEVRINDHMEEHK